MKGDTLLKAAKEAALGAGIPAGDDTIVASGVSQWD